MTTLNKEIITELLEMDRERTQGRWEHFSRSGINAVRTPEKVDVVRWMGFDGLLSSDAEANAAFIAAAPELAEHLRLAMAEVERLSAEVARGHARLKIDRCFVGEKMTPTIIPMEERATFPDGITCRDETINGLDGMLKERAFNRNAVIDQCIGLLKDYTMHPDQIPASWHSCADCMEAMLKLKEPKP